MMTPSLFRRLRADSRGVSAVEFALIAPVILLFYFALTEFCQAQMAQKRVNHVAATIGDLVAQNGQLTRSEVDSFLQAGDLIMAPYPVQTLRLRVSSVIRQNDAYTVQWSRGSNWSGSAAPTVPDGMISNGQTVIVSEARYTYVSAMNLADGVNLSHTAYNLPRDQGAITLAP